MLSLHVRVLLRQVQQHELHARAGLPGLRGPGGGRDLGHPGSIPSAEGGLTALVRQDERTKGRESRWDDVREASTRKRMWLQALM